MDDIEKIIKAWERCRECSSQPAGMSEAWVECEYTIGLYCAQDKLVNDTIKLLKTRLEDTKEKERVAPVIRKPGWNKSYYSYECPECKEEIVFEQKYCPKCGRLIECDKREVKT